MAHPVTEFDILQPENEEVVIPQRPAPTPEQARLGIMPAASGTGRFMDVMEWARSAPRFDGSDDEFEAFERAIAENRAMRRQIAQERNP
jgi:hypothetical protein